jgi:hypothetical protein
MRKMSDEWKVYNLYVSSPDKRQEIVRKIGSFAEKLVEDGNLAGFYYNLYYIPKKVPAHVRFGFYRLGDERELREKFEKLKKQGRITKVELAKPDLSDADGVTVDEIKLTARKVTELLKADFGKAINKKQAYYLIHLAMNPFFGYVDEREIYLSLAMAMEKAIRESGILPKDQWLSFLNP